VIRKTKTPTVGQRNDREEKRREDKTRLKIEQKGKSGLCE